MSIKQLGRSLSQSLVIIGWNSSELGRRCGCSSSLVSKWKSNDTAIPDDVLRYVEEARKAIEKLKPPEYIPLRVDERTKIAREARAQHIYERSVDPDASRISRLFGANLEGD